MRATSSTSSVTPTDEVAGRTGTPPPASPPRPTSSSCSRTPHEDEAQCHDPVHQARGRGLVAFFGHRLAPPVGLRTPGSPVRIRSGPHRGWRGRGPGLAQGWVRLCVCGFGSPRAGRWYFASRRTARGTLRHPGGPRAGGWPECRRGRGLVAVPPAAAVIVVVTVSVVPQRAAAVTVAVEPLAGPPHERLPFAGIDSRLMVPPGALPQPKELVRPAVRPETLHRSLRRAAGRSRPIGWMICVVCRPPGGSVSTPGT